ncbi:MAG: hypothetical protein JNM93_11510 [Bacteriovoracaceae bacterium]|nr:hypothetical protein [Bacteriovoracaceae bacterium]
MLFLLLLFLNLSYATCDQHLTQQEWIKNNYQASEIILADYAERDADRLIVNNMLVKRHQKLVDFLNSEKIVYQKGKDAITITPIREGHLFNKIAYELKANFDVDYYYNIYRLYDLESGLNSMAMVNENEKAFYASYETYEVWEKGLEINFVHEFVHLWITHAQKKRRNYTPLSFQIETDDEHAILDYLPKNLEPKIGYPANNFYDAEELLTYLTTIYTVLGLPEAKMNNYFYYLESDVDELQDLLFFNQQVIDYFKRNKHDYAGTYYRKYEGRPGLILHTKDDKPAAIQLTLQMLARGPFQAVKQADTMKYAFWFFEQYENRAVELDSLRIETFNWLLDYKATPKEAMLELPKLREKIGCFLKQELFGSPDGKLPESFPVFRELFK